MAKSIPGAWNPSDGENKAETPSLKRKRSKKLESELYFQAACSSFSDSLSSLSSALNPPAKKSKTLSEGEERLYDLEMKLNTLPDGPTKQYFERKRNEILSSLQ